jgi:toxin-antitoxin system PIN domain toxin
MLIADLNLLLYATNADAPQHERARRWWESAVTGDENVGLAWIVILGFVRIATNPRIMSVPLTLAQALAIVGGWLAQPGIRVVEPTDRHWRILEELLAETGAAGNLTSDAHLAALAIEHGATLCSADRDFARFERLRWHNPLAG